MPLEFKGSFSGTPNSATEEGGFVSGVTDFATYGISSAALSAGISFLNTGKALANVFGANLEETDTEDTLRSWGMTDTADYYQDNKSFVDGIAFAAGSLVPGLAGIKALRAGQKALSTTTRLSTGFRKALIPEDAIAATTKSIREKGFGAFSEYKSERLGMVMRGFQQQAFEAAAFESAVLVTMNQAPSLEGADLDYFDGIASNLDVAATGLIFGTAIGGTLSGFSLNGQIKKLIKEDELTNKGTIAVSVEGDNNNFALGSKILSPWDSYIKAKTAIESKEFADLTPGIKANRREQISAAEGKMQIELLKLADGDVVIRDQMWGVLQKMSGPEAFEAGARLLANQARIRGWYNQDKVFDVPVSAIQHTSKEGLIDGAYKLLRRSRPGITREQVASEFESTQGFMIDNRNFFGKGVQGFARISLEDLDNIYVWRHETAHTLLNEAADSLSWQTPIGKRLLSQGETLSRIASPERWKAWDEYNAMFQAGEELSPHALKYLKYMKKPRELLAEAGAMMSNPRFGVDVAKDFPDLYNLMIGNKALGAALNSGTSALELSSGRLLDKNIVPTAADLGGEVRITSKYVEYGTRRERIGFNQEFDTKKLKPEQANALFSSAAKWPGLKAGQQVQITDLPKLNAAMVQKIPVKVMDGKTEVTGLYADLSEALIRGKIKVAKELIERSNKSQAIRQAKGQPVHDAPQAMSPEVIGRYIDTGPEFVNRVGVLERLTAEEGNTFRGALDPDRDIPFWSQRPGQDPTKPSYIMMDADPKAIMDDNLIRGSVGAHMQIKAQREFNDSAVVAPYHGEEFAKLPPAAYESDYNAGLNITSVDATSNPVMNANSDYLSGMSTFTYIGKYVHNLIGKKHAVVDDTFNSQRVMLEADQDAIYEAAALDLKLRQVQSGGEYEFIPDTLEEFVVQLGVRPTKEALEQISGAKVLDTIFPIKVDGNGVPIPEVANRIWSQEPINVLKSLLESTDDISEALDGLEELFSATNFAIKNQRLAKFWRTQVAHNGKEIVPHKNRLNAALGRATNLNPRALYAGGIDTKRFKYHALVVPTNPGGFMGSSDAGMIIATNAEQLERKVARAREIFGQEISVYTDPKIKEYKLALAEYDKTKLFRDSYMDSALKKRGIAWDVLTEPDVGIFNQYTNMLKGQHTGLVRQTTALKYGEEYATLEQSAQQAELYNSTFGKAPKARNIYRDAMNIMLDRRPDDPESIWNTVNAVTSEKFSQAFAKVSGAVRQAQATGDWKLMNEKLSQFGIPQVYSEASQLILHNLDAPRPVLEPLVAKANAFVGTMMLRLDNTQGIVNMLSLPIMATSEMAALTKVAKTDRMQVLRNGTSIKLPGTEISVPDNGALLFQAMKNLTIGKNKKELYEKYRGMGLITSIPQEMAQLSDEFAGLAKVTDPAAANKTLDNLLKKAATFTDYSEQLGKAVAANMADMVLDTLRIPEYLKAATINTYVNRVHGNYLASQRPTLFQGWMGQAVGLFQTYQFNLIQSFLKNVEAGNKGAVAKMVGLQAGIFGAQSVPGFQLANQYIGERSLENNDFYSTTVGALGDAAGNALLYGLASSATIPLTGQGIDLYSRGDLTPRTPILIPTSVAEIPVVGIISNFVSSVTGMMGKIHDGAPPVSSMMNALAHNGLNRPIQGLFQLMAGERTTGDGKLLMDYQGWDYWNTITKVMGTKPLDEAVAASSFYRTASYKAARQEQLDSLGVSYREVVRAGEDDTASYMSFMQKYTERGGNADRFNQWVVNNYRNATESQIARLRDNNNSPEGRYLQQVMGADVEAWVGEAQ